MGDETIMIVDDKKSIRNILYDLLTDKGYHVFTFKDGIDALEEFKAEPEKFDLILTDMTMPGTTGDKLAAEILKIEPEKPIILCTGFSENISVETAKNMGIKKSLQKPVSSHEILVSIRNIFD